MIKQILKYGVVGSCAAATNFLVTIALVYFFQLHPLVANIFGFLVAFNMSFWGHHLHTFKHGDRHHKESLPRFFVVASSGFVLNEGLYYLFLHETSLHYILSLLIVLLIVACYTFTLGKLWAFKA